MRDAARKEAFSLRGKEFLLISRRKMRTQNGETDNGNSENKPLGGQSLTA